MDSFDEPPRSHGVRRRPGGNHARWSSIGTPGTEHAPVGTVASTSTQPGSSVPCSAAGSDGDDGGAASRAVRTVIATADTTLYEANFVAAHEHFDARPSLRVPASVTIGPDDSDGYYPLRSRVTMSAEPAAGSGFRFLRWEIRSDYGVAVLGDARDARDLGQPGAHVRDAGAWSTPPSSLKGRFSGLNPMRILSPSRSMVVSIALRFRWRRERCLTAHRCPSRGSG